MDDSRKRKRSVGHKEAASQKLSKSIDIVPNLSEIDIILGHTFVNDVTFYLVKWKGRDRRESAWLPASRVLGCGTALYYQQVMLREAPPSLDAVRHFVRDVTRRSPHDALTLRRLCGLVFGCSEETLLALELSFDELRKKALRVLTIPEERLERLRLRRTLLRLMRFAEERKRSLLGCAEWEQRASAASQARVSVENDVDCAEPPPDYVILGDYVSSYVDLTAKPAVSCSCDDCGAQPDTCCAALLGGKPPYDEEGRVVLPPGYEVYECNSGCLCGPDCPFRVVQRGPGPALAVFRTRDDRGWGLRAEEDLDRGQFALEYLGEVITPQDAEVRDGAYDLTGATYLFDLEGGVFTVDAGRRGNAARFINHACDPNMQVYCVWGEQQDPALPRLAMFTRRKVKKGEELTFDYKMDHNCEGERVPCRCGSKKCRKFLF